MIHYATDTEHCRSQLLLSYFGEDNSQLCHQCDYCLKDKSRPIDLVQEVKALLSQKPMTLNDLIEQLPHQATAIIETVRLLMDKNEITLHNNLLQLRV